MTSLAPAPASHPGTSASLQVDPAAIATNTRFLAGRTQAELMAVVKADGFGHGAVTVARTALTNGASWLGVTSLTEAFALREARIEAPVLSWLNPVDADWAGAARAGIDVAVGSLAHLAAIVNAGGPVARVHLHL